MQELQTKEIKNARLAMVAFVGETALKHYLFLLPNLSLEAAARILQRFVVKFTVPGLLLSAGKRCRTYGI